MAKEKGKRKKGKKTGQPNAKIKKKVHMVTPTKTIVPAPAEGNVLEPESNSNVGDSQVKEKETQKSTRLPGFIFMCNPNTKLECYQYRVFGLPTGKKEVVEQIRPGSKLFLFDFELKLLYGIYEATSPGKLNLEPAAFKGRFPAQVKFKIFKECLPMAESSLRHVINENYTGSKFKQELSGKQVKKLLSSFRPLTASSSQPTPQAMAPRPMLPPVRFPRMEVPYVPQHVDPRSVPKVNYLQQHGNYHRPAAYVARPALDHQSFPGTSGYYVANSQRPPIEGVVHGVQQQPYSRHMTIEERAPHHDQITNFERQYRPVQQRAPTNDQISHLARKYLQVPLQSQTALYHQDNAPAYNSNPPGPTQYNTSSATQPQVPAHHYHQLPSHNVAAYNNSNPTGPSQYTSSVAAQTQVQAQAHVQAQYASSAVSQQQGPAHYHQLPVYGHENVGAYKYASSVAQTQGVGPGISQGSAPISSYYSYTGATRLNR